MNLFINILGGLALLAAGLLCLPPRATSEGGWLKRSIEAVAPYAGWFGVVLLVWGLWGVLGAVIGLGALRVAPLLWLTSSAASALSVGAGFFLGHEMIQKRFLLNASDETKQRVEGAYKWLTERQNSVSLLSLAIGVWLIVYSVIFLGRVRF
jgi:hypothetical protein